MKLQVIQVTIQEMNMATRPNVEQSKKKYNRKRDNKHKNQRGW